MQNYQRGFSGVWVPKQILDSTELTPGEKILYANIASFDKCCFETNERLSEKCGIADRSISRALARLESLGFIVVELVKGNTSKRRIYAILDNPKKIEYLVKKGLFHSPNSEDDGEEQPSFPQTRQNGESQLETRQNGESTRQNGESRNGGETRQNVHQRINKKKEEKENPEQKPNYENTPGIAAVEGPRLPDYSKPPKRKDFDDDEAFEKAYYAWRGC